MAGRQAGSSGASEPSSSPRVSPPKVIVDDSPLQPAMGKHKESLKVKLMMRRPINQLVAQGIMPPSKTPPAYFEQCKQLERAKTGDLLKAKIQRRPDRQELERRHILEQESHVDPSLAEKQRMLKKARLADQLNDQLSHRPGPLELIKKNILHTEETIETAVKSGSLAFRATSEGASGRPEHPSSYCGPPEELSPSPSPPSTLSPPSVHSPPQHPAPGKDKPRKKNCKKQQTTKARFKFHEYKGPPNARAATTPPGSVETPYELLLQQQQLLLQLMLPASPAPSSAASDSSEAYGAPPPPPPPPAPAHCGARFEDMKVSDLRAECKRRNLRVSGPKPQLIDRLRQEERPKSPASVASAASCGSPEARSECDQSEDIVRSQQRQIEELERKLEASRHQLEAVRREAAGASDQSRRLLQAHLCVSQLRAQLDALQQPAAAPRHQYVLAAPAPDAAPDRLVRLFTVASPAPAPSTAPAPAPPQDSPAAHLKPPNNAYILNGVKVVPIAILPSAAHYEPERAPPAPPPPPPPPPLPPPVPDPATVRDSSEESQIMDDVLEILVENGELPPSAVERADGDGSLPSSEAAFSPADVLGGSAVGARHARDSLAAEELQRELDDIQNEIMSHADMQAGGAHAGPDLDPDLSMDLLSNGDFHAEFAHDTSAPDGDDFFERFLSGHERDERRSPIAMDIGDDADRLPMTPLTNGDILEHSRHGFDYIDDLSLPSFQSEETRHGPFDERGEYEPRDPGCELVSMNVDGDGYDLMETDLFPNMFGRGHVPQCDPLLGGVLARPPPRPALKHYSWDKIEFDAT